MKKLVATIALLALAAVAGVTGYKLVTTLIDYRSASDFYDDMARTYVAPRGSDAASDAAPPTAAPAGAEGAAETAAPGPAATEEPLPPSTAEGEAAASALPASGEPRATAAAGAETGLPERAATDEPRQTSAGAIAPAESAASPEPLPQSPEEGIAAPAGQAAAPDEGVSTTAPAEAVPTAAPAGQAAAPDEGVPTAVPAGQAAAPDEGASTTAPDEGVPAASPIPAPAAPAAESVEYGTGAIVGAVGAGDAFVRSAAVSGASLGVVSDRAALPPRLTVEQPPLEVDFEGLQKINPDVVGWIYCEDTQINYPVLQGRDNQQYLHRRVDGSASASGSIFLDSLCDAAFRGDNALLYGHHMKNGSMFAGLSLFGEREYFDAHPHLWLLTPGGSYRIRLFAGFLSLPDDWVYYVTFADTAGKADYIDRAAELSMIDAGWKPSPLERLITLSTCDYTFKNARYVLLGTLTPVADPRTVGAAAVAAGGKAVGLSR